MWHGKSCSLIIPAKNEEQNLSLLKGTVPEFIDEIILVIAESSDGTLDVASAFDSRSRVVNQMKRGKGAALSLGFKEAKSEFVFIIDADGSMRMSELQKYAEALEAGNPIVKGSRYLPGGGSDDITKFRSAGNLFLTKTANVLFDAQWTDLAYGFAAFHKKALTALEVSMFDNKVPGRINHRRMAYGQGFEIETLIFCRARRRGLRVMEIPSWENNRVFGSSNLRAISDGFRALAALLTERMRSRRDY